MTKDPIDRLEEVFEGASKTMSEGVERAEAAADQVALLLDDAVGVTRQRTSWARLVAISAAGVVVATMLVLVAFVQIAARCSEPTGVCAAFAPASEAQSEVVEELVTGILYGVEYIDNGGTANGYLAGASASQGVNLAVVVRDDGGEWLVVSAAGSPAFLERTGLDLSPLDEGPQPVDEIFDPSDPSQPATLALIEQVFASRQAAPPLQGTTASGVTFTVRAFPFGPDSVALLTTVVDES